MSEGTARVTDAMAGGASPVPSASRSQAEFRRAERHSRWVRLLKIGLPLIASVMVLIGIAVTWFARSLPADIAAAATSIEDGRLVMEDPRVSGSDNNDRPYSLIARRAIQSLSGGGIDLEAIRADLSVDAETTATLVAANGHYKPDVGQLRLYDDITVDTSSGISIRLSSADIDVDAGKLVGSGPVLITTPNQSLQSGTVTIQDGGSRLSFGNRVKLTLLPNGEAGKARRISTSDQP